MRFNFFLGFNKIFKEKKGPLSLHYSCSFHHHDFWFDKRDKRCSNEKSMMYPHTHTYYGPVRLVSWSNYWMIFLLPLMMIQVQFQYFLWSYTQCGLIGLIEQFFLELLTTTLHIWKYECFFFGCHDSLIRMVRESMFVVFPSMIFVAKMQSLP